jgi:hypothetical protein
LLALVALTVLFTVLTTAVGVDVAPPLALSLPVVLGGILLPRPALRLLLVAVTVAFVIEVGHDGWKQVRPGSAVVLALVAFLCVELARDR